MPAEPQEPPVTPPPSAKPRRRWRLVLAAFTLLLVLAAWFAPAVVARTPLRNRLVQGATADLRGTVTVGRASLGWFSPVELRDVTVTDEQGRTLLSAPKVTSSKTLFALLRDRSDLGEFAVERLAAEVVCEQQSTNLEAALASYLKDDGTPPGPDRPAVSVVVTDGTLTVRDADKAWTFDGVAVNVAVPRSRAEPVTATLAARTGPGTLAAEVSVGDAGRVALDATAFPLDALTPVLRRVEPAASVAGRLTAKLTATWGRDAAGKPTVGLDGTAAVADLDLAGPWLKGDRLRLASLTLPVKLDATGRAVRVEKAELTCDVGTVRAAGSFDPDRPFDQLLDQPGVTLAADLNLAKLAAVLPRLLRVRDGTTVTAGRLTATLSSAAHPAGTTWAGDVRTSALQGTRGGQHVEWKEPFAVEFTGRFPPGQVPLLDRLTCRSDFIALVAKSEPDSLRAAANVYLDVLCDRLAEFVDLGGARLGGSAAVRLVVKRAPAGDFKAGLEVDLTKFALADRAGHVLREEAVAVRLTADGTATAAGPFRVAAAGLAVTAGTDELHLTLAGPIADARSVSAAAFGAKIGGDLDRWMSRVRAFVSVPKHYAFAGRLAAAGTVRVNKEKLAVDRLTLTLERVRFRGAGLDLDEPTMSAVADLTLTWATSATVLENFTITSAPLSVAGGRLAFEPQPNGDLAASGGGPATTDLARLGKALRLSTDPAGADALRGRGVGPIHFRNCGTATTFVGTLDVTDFAYGDPKKTGIAEKTLRLEADGRYDDPTDTVTLAKARVARPGLAADAKGSFGKFDTTQDVSLDGTLTYDLARLTPELRAAVGGDFEARGTGTRPISMKGSLAAGGTVATLRAPGSPPPGPFARLTADAGLGWDAVRAYGFETGPGDLTARLANGTLHVSPVRAGFAGSTITLAPTARLDPAPGELTFARGRIVERAKLTPQALAGGLGYVLPAIANAAHAEGTITLTLGDNRIPLDDFSKATVKGELLVHSATVSAGPLVTELSHLLGGPATQLALANEMTVPVRVESGRVHHENFALSVNGVVIRTSGSVGFDGSLALVADVPVPAAAFAGTPRLMQALKDKRVPVPVGGTVAKPAVDPRQFQAAVARLAQDAAKDVGRDVLNKELERVFPFKK